jgi:hypothetical protein
MTVVNVTALTLTRWSGSGSNYADDPQIGSKPYLGTLGVRPDDRARS